MMDEMLTWKFNPDDPYPFEPGRRLGRAFIVNNLKHEMPTTEDDVAKLQDVYEKVGFQVKEGIGYDFNEMEKLMSTKIMKDSLFDDSHCFILTVLAHGNEYGQLMAARKDDKAPFILGWQIDDIVNKLDQVDQLRGKPKIIIVDACRGKLVTAGHPVRAPQAQQETPELHFVADKADFFIGYATVHGYSAAGSYFLCSFAKNLERLYKTHSIDRIFTCVKRDMDEIRMNVRKREGNTLTIVENAKICPEDRSSLRRLCFFTKQPETKGISKEMVEKQRDGSVDELDSGSQPPTTAPRAGNDKEQGNQPPGNIEYKLTDIHILKVAEAINDPSKYRKLAIALDQGSKLQTNLTNNPSDITSAAFKLLTGWKVSKANVQIQWTELYKALGDAELEECKSILEQ